MLGSILVLSFQNGSLELNLAISPDLLKFFTSTALSFSAPSPQLCNWLEEGKWEEAREQKTKAAAREKTQWKGGKENNSATAAAQIIKRGSPHIAFDHSKVFEGL